MASSKRFRTSAGSGSRDRERQLPDDDALPLRLELPRLESARVLVVRQQHLVAGRKIEAVGDEAHPLGGVARQRDLVRVGPDERGQLPPQAALGPDVPRVLPARVGGQGAVGVDERVVDGLRHRPQRAAVQIGQLVRDEELAPHPLPVGRLRGGAPGRVLPAAGTGERGCRRRRLRSTRRCGERAGGSGCERLQEAPPRRTGRGARLGGTDGAIGLHESTPPPPAARIGHSEDPRRTGPGAKRGCPHHSRYGWEERRERPARRLDSIVRRPVY